MATANAWIAVLLIAQCLHVSHAFVSQRPFVTKSTCNRHGPRWEATNKKEDNPNDAPAFVMPASNNSTVAVVDKGNKHDTTEIISKESVASNHDDSPKKKMTPVEKAMKALEKESVNATTKSNGSEVKKAPVNVGIGVLAPKVPSAPKASRTIYDRKEVPPLEQIPSKEKAPKTKRDASDVVQAKADGDSVSEEKSAKGTVIAVPSAGVKDKTVKDSKPVKAEASSVAVKKDTLPSDSVKAKADGDASKAETEAKLTSKTGGGASPKEEANAKSTLSAGSGGETEDTPADASKPLQPMTSSAVAKKDALASEPVQVKAAVGAPEETKDKATLIAASGSQIKDKTTVDAPKPSKTAPIASPKDEIKDTADVPKPLKEETPSVNTKNGAKPNTAPKVEAKESQKDVWGKSLEETKTAAETKGKAAPVAPPKAEGKMNSSKPAMKKAPPVTVKIGGSAPVASTKVEVKDTAKDSPKPRKEMSPATHEKKATVSSTLPSVEKPSKDEASPEAGMKGDVGSSAAPKTEAKGTTLGAVSVSSTSPKVEVKEVAKDPPKVMKKETSGKEETKSKVSSGSPKVEAKDALKEEASAAITKGNEKSAPAPKIEMEDAKKDVLMSVPPAKKDATSPVTASKRYAAAVEGEKSGIEALADFFFGSKVASEQEDADVMQRIKARKQAREEERNSELSLSEQLQAAKDTLNEFKQESEQTIVDLHAEAKENEAYWRVQVNEMTAKAEVAEKMNQQAQRAMQDMTVNQIELDSEAKEWKEMYARECTLWTDKYDSEREYRRQEQIAARERLSKYMSDSRNQLKLANEEGRKREDMIRAELTRVLEQTKRTLSYTTTELKKAKIELEAKDAKIEELGGDRDSLRQLTGEAWGLIKERTRNRWKKLRGRAGNARKTERIEK